MKNNIIKKLMAFTMIMLTGNGVFAQSESIDIDPEMTMNIMISLVLVIAIIVLLVLMYMLNFLNVIVNEEAMKRAEAKGEQYVAEPSVLATWWAGLTNAIPIEKESEIDLNHDYDGIRELDNHLPPWWTALFYITIVFAVVYLFAYHVTGSLPLQDAEYQQEVAAAAALKTNAPEEAAIDESNIVFSDDPAVQASGKKVYERNCVACHKTAGEGGIGPNLTDDYWIHGGSIQDVYYTIKVGVPDKGMIAWSDVLSPAKMSDVTSYIYTLRGTNPPNAKAPQGELYVEEKEAAPVDTTATE